MMKDPKDKPCYNLVYPVLANSAHGEAVRAPLKKGGSRKFELDVPHPFLETGPLELPGRLPMVVEAETGFHFRRRGDRLVIAMPDSAPRWGTDTTVDESVFADRLARLAHRFPAAAGTTIANAWAGLYDMTPDAHPIVGRIAEGVYAACGFSGHGFMQSPAVGRALAAEILGGESPFDLAPYRLERFAGGAVFPETVVL